MPRSRTVLASSLSLLLAACLPARTPEPPPAAATVAPTPLRFSVAAEPNDTWNAVGQILVRTPGVAYDGRSQMIGLYAIRYRGESLMMLTRGVPVSGAVTVPTTEISVTGTQGKAAPSEGAAELLALLARELPAEIERVKARFAAEKAARAKARPPKQRSKNKTS